MCNHVWNYQQAIPYLFGDLQRSMLENFMFNGLRESDGGVIYRMPVGPGAKVNQQGGFTSAADGQLGQVCQVYRDWQICGDDAWLRAIWPKTKKALEYAWVAWDKDRDGLLEGRHHNTLDLDFRTPETMCGSLYQAALLAGERMALYMGDAEAAKEYRRVFESGKKLSDEKLFNGEYYHQMLPAPGGYQLGAGSISEQIHGQLYARMLGLEDIYSRDNIRKAAASLFKYNYVTDSYDRINTNRVYSLSGDFRVFFSVDSGWGIVSQKKGKKKQTVKIEVRKGKLAVEKLNLMVNKRVKKLAVRMGSSDIAGKIKKADNEFWDADKMVTVQLDNSVNVVSGQPLVVEMRF